LPGPRRHLVGGTVTHAAARRASLLLVATGHSLFDPLIADAIAPWIIATTTQEIMHSHDQLMWPGKIVCAHGDDDAAVRTG